VGYFFLDTSCLVKRYVQETGRAAVLALVAPEQSNATYVCDAAGPELVAALARRARDPAAPTLDIQPTLTGFRRHWHSEYRRIGLGGTVIERAMDVAATHGWRGYDAIHLAAALELADAIRSHDLPPLVFVSADQEQLDAAAAEGLAILDPAA
jgi:uncharacterized protein